MRPLFTSAALGAAAAASFATLAGAAGQPPGPAFSNPGQIDNRYLPLTAHRTCEYHGTSAGGARTRSVLTRLDRTRRFEVAGKPVDAAVFRDDAFEDGRRIESTFDYFAQADDGTVYYLGEDVREYRDGRLVSREGSWRYGRQTDVLGVAMPPSPQVGLQWRLEDVPGITQESDRLEEAGMRAEAGGRLYTDVIRTQEFVQPEGEVEYKLYAPGVGTITEYPPGARSELVRCR